MPQVPAMQDESHRSTHAPGTAGPRGIHKDPYGVTVTLDGRVSTVGRCTPVHYREVVAQDVSWIRYDIEKLLFSQAAALLALQGWPLGKFFDGARFSSPLDATDITVLSAIYSGTFVFLRGELSELTHPPLTLSKIVLAKVIRFKEGMTRDELLSAMLEDVLSPRFQ